MSIEIWIALIITIPPTLTGIAAILTALGNRKRQRKWHMENSERLDGLGKLMKQHIKEFRKNAGKRYGK